MGKIKNINDINLYAQNVISKPKERRKRNIAVIKIKYTFKLRVAQD